MSLADKISQFFFLPDKDLINFAKTNCMNYKFITGIFLLYSFLFIFSCVPPEKKPLDDSQLDYSDEIFRKVMNFQDKRETDSIIKYIDHENALYRYAALKAIISVQDSAKLDLVIARLKDEDPLVRETAALALGLIGNISVQDSLMMVFGKYDTINPNSRFNENVLEAIGRIGNNKYLKSIATISTYRPSDSLLIMGQMKALYRFIYRKKSVPEGTVRVIEILTSDSYPLKARYIATNYLMLCSQEELSQYKFDLIKVLRNNENNIIRKNIAIALGKTADPQALIVFREMLSDSLLDISLKENIFKALKNFNYPDVIDIVVKSLESKNSRIAYAAADYIYTNGLPKTYMAYKNLGDIQLSWQAKTRLYAATLKHIPVYYGGTKARIIEELKIQFSQISDPYAKAAYIRSIGEDINSYSTLYELGFKSDNLILRTAAMESLGGIMKSEIIGKMSTGAKNYYKKSFMPMLNEAFYSGDPGLISAASDAILNSSIDFSEELEDGQILKNAGAKLKMPRDAEALTGLQKLEAKLKGKSIKSSGVPFNNPIDWNKFDELNDEVSVVVETNKGNFELTLYKKAAPGTVVSFVKLIKSGFFNNKFFHRVVPNFVIQTGCPRGDGYGSPDFTLRTEISSMQYNDEGWVGMASAGRDTESSQWFVTLGPAPHLDGNYTIFGKVKRGMEVIRNIEIGDKISIVKLNK